MFFSEKESELLGERESILKMYTELDCLKKERKNLLQKVCILKHRNRDLLEINIYKIENLKLQINEKVKDSI